MGGFFTAATPPGWLQWWLQRRISLAKFLVPKIMRLNHRTHIGQKHENHESFRRASPDLTGSERVAPQTVICFFQDMSRNYSVTCLELSTLFLERER